MFSTHFCFRLSVRTLLLIGVMSMGILMPAGCSGAGPNDDHETLREGFAAIGAADYAAAVEALRSVAASPLDSVAANARYNLGYAYQQLAMPMVQSDPKAAIEHLDHAIAAYRGALRIEPNNSDARVNWEVAATLRHQLRMKQKAADPAEQDPQPGEPSDGEKGQQASDDPSPDENESDDRQSDDDSSEGGDPDADTDSSESQSDDGNRDEDQPSNEAGNSADEDPSDSGENDGGDGTESESESSGNQESTDEQKSTMGDDGQSSLDESSGESSRDESASSESKTGRSEDQAANQEAEDQNANDPSSGQPEPSNASEQPGESDSMDDDKLAEQLNGELQSNNEDDVRENAQNAALPNDGDPSQRMTRQEAEKMLQAIRDRNFLRQLRLEQIRRQSRIRVPKDW